MHAVRADTYDLSFQSNAKREEERECVSENERESTSGKEKVTAPVWRRVSPAPGKSEIRSAVACCTSQPSLFFLLAVSFSPSLTLAPSLSRSPLSHSLYLDCCKAFILP
ncbi:hypothetical protein Baya_7006 [Bagarius yarrelli]|uniref:Uncharacterized protein n=1 Tax=Bagarius yarrelli TaxID=175774 RepID=A0A556U3J4_BAGYA|nr:hypothetical protein Baya_7006 [Bagarius yarrelli]